MPTSPSTRRTHGDPRPARDRILDSAATIMRRDGLAHATTKEIAKEAGCSEALLYKHFPDKRDIFVRVLTERSPTLERATDLPGTATVPGNLEHLVVSLLKFYEQGFPIAASIFSNTELLVAHRQAMKERGAGPHGPSRILEHYLDQEVHLGRLHEMDTGAVARLLTGAALHEAFLTTYTGDPIRDPSALARRLVGAFDFHH